MKARIVIAAVGSIALLGGCVGVDLPTIESQLPLSSIVQRVSLSPGVDALDPSGPTAVGTDWRTIVFTLTEPVTSASVTTFDPSCSLIHPGLALDPSVPPFFNAAAAGLLAPRTRLTVMLNPMAAGSYTFTLKSGNGCPALQSQDANGNLYTFEGSFTFSVSVVEKDGVLPYIVDFRPVLSGASDQVSLLEWIFGGGSINEGSTIPPHALLEVDFSKEMRTPLPVEVEPTIQGRFSSLGTTGPVPDGISFVPTIGTVKWDDLLDGVTTSKSARATVLTSLTPSGMDLDGDYTLTFTGIEPLSTYQSLVVDRSGQPLTLRFSAGNSLTGETGAEARMSPVDDIRKFHTAPVRIEMPSPPFELSQSSFASGNSASIAISGTMATRVDEVDLSLESQDGSIFRDLGPATPTSLNGQTNALGVQIDAFSGSAAVNAADPDGNYLLTANAFTGGQPVGSDVVTIVKDTSGPKVFSGWGDVNIDATDTAIPPICVNVSDDTVEADLLVGGSLLIANTTYAEVPGIVVLGAPRTAERRFCFDTLQVTTLIKPGDNLLTLQLKDTVGNVSNLSAHLFVHGVISSISPQDAEPGSTVVVLGYGIQDIAAADTGIFDGGSVSLGHGTNADGSGPEIFQQVFGAGDPLGSLVAVEIRIPDFVASGPLSFLIGGVSTNSKPLAICSPPVSPFERDGNGLYFSEPGAVTRFGDITETGLSPSVASPGAFDPAGQPLVFDGTVAAIAAPIAKPTATAAPTPALIASAWDGTKWQSYPTVPIAQTGSSARAIAAARRPYGDAAFAFELVSSSAIRVELAERSPDPTGGSPVWLEAQVAQFSSGATPPAALALAFAPDGRAAVAYTAPRASDGKLTLFVSMETAPDSRTFAAPVPLSSAPGIGNAVSLALDSQDNAWVAYTNSIVNARATSFANYDYAGFAISVAKVAVSGEVSDVSAPAGHGVWPSLSISSGGRVDVAYQSVSASETNLQQAHDCVWKTEVSVGQPFVAELDGAAWNQQAIDGNIRSIPATDFPQFTVTPTCSTVALISGDASKSVARGVLRTAPDGTLKFVYVRNAGRLVFAKRPSGGSWTIGTAVLGQKIGGTIGMSLDGVGRARVVYQDGELGQVRVWREDDDRSVDASIDEEGCNAAAFTRALVTPDPTHLRLTNLNSFTWNWLENLPDISPAVVAEKGGLTAEQLFGSAAIASAQSSLRAIYLTAMGDGGLAGTNEPAWTVRSLPAKVQFDLEFPPGAAPNDISSFWGETDSNPLNFDLAVRTRAMAPGTWVRIVAGIGPNDVTCVTGSPDDIAHMTPTAVAACAPADVEIPLLQACAPDAALGLCGGRYLFLLEALSPVQTASNYDQGSVVVDSLTLHIHGASESVSAEPDTAGGYEFDAIVPTFDLEGTYVGGSICHSVPFSVVKGARLAASGLLSVAPDSVAEVTQPVLIPSLSVKPSDIDFHGSGCAVTAEILTYLKGVPSSGLGAAFSACEYPDPLDPTLEVCPSDVWGGTLVTPALQDNLSFGGVGTPWEVDATSGTLDVISRNASP